MIDIRRSAPTQTPSVPRLARRGVSAETVDSLREIDEPRRAVMTGAQDLRAEQKQFGRRIGQATPEERPALIEESGTFSARIDQLEAREVVLDARQTTILLGIPNLPHPDTLDGSEDADAVELEQFGDKPSFDFEPTA
ncbi:MAG: hypothetical protein ACR2HR_09180 [Euzebya sp.]